MITYILQTIVFQLVFLTLYELLLKKETFFQWNRVYLLLTPLIVLVLPFVQIPALGTVVPQNLIVTLPEVILGTKTAAAEKSLATSSASFSVLEILLFVGMIISALLFIYKLYKIIQLKQKGKTEILGTTTLVHLPNSTDAFSFAGTIYLGESLNQNSKEYILSHEKVHVKQKHYVDLLYFELLRIVFWFNPLVYFYQKRIATLHEYIADAEVILQSEKATYYQNLLSEVFQTHTISFTNTFFNHSLIKKRIVMLHKAKSKKIQLIKYAFLLPVMTGMLLFTSCEQSEKESEQQAEEVIEKKVETESIPFAVIDHVPLYPGCENLLSNEERKQCMSENLSNLVLNNFNSSVVNGLGLEGRQRIAVQFKIDAQGNVVDVLSRAPNNMLEEEAKRVIGLIPQMQPGQQDGKPVAVMYSLPIVFEVKE